MNTSQTPRRAALRPLIALLACCGGAAAQSPAATTVVPPVAELERLAQVMVDTTRQWLFDEDTLAFAAGELRDERIAKSAPYCAEAVHERVQWLPDAGGGAPNRIVHKQSTKLCRDGEGRTRQEVERGGRSLVYLRDPAAGESWVLDPQRKTARRIGSSSLRADINFDQSIWRDYAERMRTWANEVARSMREHGRDAGRTPPTPPTPPVPPTPPTPATPATPTVGATAVGPVIIHRGSDGEREVRVLRLGEGTAPPPPLPAVPAPPSVRWQAQALAPRGSGVETPLPAKEIEGVRANGVRTTWTIEAGKIGNERPIQIVREVWTSPELLLTLATRDFDPRSGEVLYQLRNLKRGEPDPALMRVPADYSTSGRSAPRSRPGASEPSSRG